MLLFDLPSVSWSYIHFCTCLCFKPPKTKTTSWLVVKQFKESTEVLPKRTFQIQSLDVALSAAFFQSAKAEPKLDLMNLQFTCVWCFHFSKRLKKRPIYFDFSFMKSFIYWKTNIQIAHCWQRHTRGQKKSKWTS